MKPIRTKLLVLSGKGGVGKSTVSAQLAFALSARTTSSSDDSPLLNVGLMDIDICGPSIPKLLHLEGESVHPSMLGWSPVFLKENLGVVSIDFLLTDSSEAVIWRGPKKNGLIKSFLKDVDWGQLDVLVVDTPPGTSDEHLTITHYLKECQKADGGGLVAVVVTTPQDVAVAEVRREIHFCQKVGIRIVGIIENMSSFICPKCKTETRIFPPTRGGGETLAAEEGVPFLGRIPLDPSLMSACEAGESFLEKCVESPSRRSLMQIV